MEKYFHVDNRPFTVIAHKPGTPLLLFDVYASCGGLSDAFSIYSNDHDICKLLMKHFPDASTSRFSVLQKAVGKLIEDDAYGADDFFYDLLEIELSGEEFNSFEFLVEEWRDEERQREMEEEYQREQEEEDKNN